MGGTYGVFRFSSLPGHGGSHVDVHGVGGRSQRKCTLKHPPGRKVYQRGAHTIWEVDGSKEKVSKYCCEVASSFHTKSSYIVRTSRYLESCSSTSRHCFSTAIIVSMYPTNPFESVRLNVST